MAGRFPQRWLDQFYQQIDIVQTVSAYVPLKRNGKRYIGLCPFHHEKTPSFNVTPGVNLYYCFGCKAGGNAVNFIMEMEHLTYMEAVRFLAEKNQIPLPELEDDPFYEQRRTEKERLYALNKEAARFYHRQLWSDAGRPVLEYFHKRGLTDDVIRKFGLGASANNRTAVLDYLTQMGYSQAELGSAGICVRSDTSGTHDMFRNRAMFPIIDTRGNVLGFGGRSLANIQPKYLNTSDTPVFNKRLGLFAINLIKKGKSLQRIILVEGYMDVVALVQFGVEGVVATLGTSLTAEQARLLKRFTNEVWIAYDGDEAGQHAIERAIGIFEQEALPAKVLFFPEGLDPDEFIRQKGKEAFDAIVPLTSTEYLMQRAEKKVDLSDDYGRMEYAKICAAILKRLKEPVELDHYLSILSLKTGFSKEVLMAQVGNTVLPAAAEVPARRRERKPASDAQETDGTGSRAEKILLALYATGNIPREAVMESSFANAQIKEIADKLLNGQTLHDLLETYSDRAEMKDLVIEIMRTASEDMSEAEALQAAKACTDQIRIRRLQREIQQLKERMAGEIQSDEHGYLIKEIMLKQKEISQLKAHANGFGGALH